MKYLECIRHHLKEWGSILLPWVTIASIPIAGWWTYHNFSITDTAEWNPVISVSVDVLSYGDKKLLVVHVHPKNIGKVPISLLGNNKGDISVSLGELPLGHVVGHISEKEITTIDKVPSLVANNSGEYDLEPGVEYDDVQYFVVPKAKATKYYVVSAELDWPYENTPEEGYEVDASTVVKIDAEN